MNQRARKLLTREAERMKEVCASLRALMDNPDDFELGQAGEADIRNAGAMAKATLEELRKLAIKQ
jgi:hypothetical protein